MVEITVISETGLNSLATYNMMSHDRCISMKFYLSEPVVYDWQQRAGKITGLKRRCIILFKQGLGLGLGFGCGIPLHQD